jgi:hypothetical protein
MSDLKSREGERQGRESEIIKELSLVSQKTMEIIEAHTKKMVRKML